MGCSSRSYSFAWWMVAVSITAGKQQHNNIVKLEQAFFPYAFLFRQSLVGRVYSVLASYNDRRRYDDLPQWADGTSPMCLSLGVCLGGAT